MNTRETLPDLSHGTTEEEYISAQAAAAEAIDVGRETLLVAAAQSEQISHANRMADEAQYALSRSARLVRGMTWSGWISNMFTNDVRLPGTDDPSHQPRSQFQYESFPEECQVAAQAILNYRCNVVALKTCETDEQKNTCLDVCDVTFAKAAEEVDAINKETVSREILSQLNADLSTTRTIQSKVKETVRDSSSTPSFKTKANESEVVASALSSRQHHAALTHQTQQDDHLNKLSKSLGELTSIGRTLGQEIEDQNEVLGTISEKADANIDTSKLVTRKANRMVQAKSWKPSPKTFHGWYFIKHISSGSFFSFSDGSLVLSKVFHPESCVFGVWTRQGNVVGLQHRYTQHWAGQSLLGNLVCTAKTFGKREEWETYDDWHDTRLCSSSANWGSGGFITFSSKRGVLSLSSSASESNKDVGRWCLEEWNEPN